MKIKYAVVKDALIILYQKKNGWIGVKDIIIVNIVIDLMKIDFTHNIGLYYQKLQK